MGRVPTEGVAATLQAQGERLATRFGELESQVRVMVSPELPTGTTVIPTESVVLDGARSSEVKWLRETHGMEVVQEGRHGKVLMQAPESGAAGVRMAFDAAREVFERNVVDAAHPNFLRAIRRPHPSVGGAGKQWALDNDGRPGLPGADVHALAAWTITEGDADIRVAVLDEGVDTGHPYLKKRVVDEADFVDDNGQARPDGDDAHGTACAGIVVSTNDAVRGLAPEASLVAVRIAKSDAQGYWIFDDFDTADAIDWSWDDAKSDVLSNSWGGGPPTDVITRAFERARTRGRRGKGAVIVVAAGNDQAAIDFPGSLPNVLTVGASNAWDQRKTRTAKDGEDWWGSNYGKSLDLLAPGVKIPTTDIRGSRGYSSSLFTKTFNGTSSACPHAAAAAALVLSVKPSLKEDRVRELINGTADPLRRDRKWSRTLGHGRLNAYAALWAARRE